MARCRDLAQAYHCLEYYGRVYEDRGLWRGDWSPVALIARLAREAVELGGDPSALEPRTDYMRESIAAALAS